jgi:hypothetical protein
MRDRRLWPVLRRSWTYSYLQTGIFFAPGTTSFFQPDGTFSKIVGIEAPDRRWGEDLVSPEVPTCRHFADSENIGGWRWMRLDAVSERNECCSCCERKLTQVRCVNCQYFLRGATLFPESLAGASASLEVYLEVNKDIDFILDAEQAVGRISRYIIAYRFDDA